MDNILRSLFSNFTVFVEHPSAAATAAAPVGFAPPTTAAAAAGSAAGSAAGVAGGKLCMHCTLKGAPTCVLTSNNSDRTTAHCDSLQPS